MPFVFARALECEDKVTLLIVVGGFIDRPFTFESYRRQKARKCLGRLEENFQVKPCVAKVGDNTCVACREAIDGDVVMGVECRGFLSASVINYR